MKQASNSNKSLCKKQKFGFQLPTCFSDPMKSKVQLIYNRLGLYFRFWLSNYEFDSRRQIVVFIIIYFE